MVDEGILIVKGTRDDKNIFATAYRTTSEAEHA
jgi:hypothetical protein